MGRERRIMHIDGTHYRTIWAEKGEICLIDQRYLPYEFVIEKVSEAPQIARAIREMHVRGAPLIGAAAAFGVYLAAREIASKFVEFSDESEAKFLKFVSEIRDSRPTAVNLQWALKRQLAHFEKVKVESRSWEELTRLLFEDAERILEEDVEICRSIGKHGLELIQEISKQKNGEPVNILTHCNAGWIATIDYGTATAPMYFAQEQGIAIHVWVDETRPRLQGSKLTAFELGHENIPHTIISDNTGGYLMQKGDVDLCLVGTDRTTRTGDVANKIGTYLKAVAAKDNNVPFYVALPSTTVDWELENGMDIPIEVRDENEVMIIEGKAAGKDGIAAVEIGPMTSPALNYAFDITPARLVTGLITEKGIAEATRESIAALLRG